jgi:hypothetical protein
MSRKFIIAIAAVAALGMSTLITTDASARFGGGGGFHGSHGGGSFSRSSFSHSRITTSRPMARTVRPSNLSKVTHIRPNMHRPNPNHRPHPHHAHHKPHHHGHHYWWWCRHHHYRCHGWYPWIDVGGVDVVPAVADAAPVAATPVAAVCNNDCDYFLRNEPGCYMAKRAFSTPAGDELRCVKICEEPEPATK